MRPVIRDTKRPLYCGPLSIAAVTGERASTVLAMIDKRREARGYGFKSNGHRMPVIGMMPMEVVGALRAMGYPAEFIKLGLEPSETNPGCVRVVPEPTLAAWLRSQKPPGAQIVLLRNHFIAVDGRHMIDTMTKGRPVALAKAPHRRARVKGYIVIGPRRIG